MIKILYFARLSENLNVKSEEIAFSSEISSVNDVVMQLSNRGAPWDTEFSDQNRVLVAVNQEMSERDMVLKDGDEVAFFPPVTGG